jgi:oligo-1,6-glucosidase
MHNPTPSNSQTVNGYTRKWWKEAVVYQIYPRSFKDSNGDGIGDLNGIISKLDYIKELGVDVIWLGPHFDSPNADNGYDIRDYRKVMAEFGTMADFDQLLQEIKRRGMKLILDLVVNHTSDEHVWFALSRESKQNACSDYYIWRPAKEGREPNNWLSFFAGSAWKYEPARGEYYLHLFAEKQPDLNWENPNVRKEVHDLMRFWLDKGIDGFRMDVIPFISKNQSFPDFPENFDGRKEYVYAGGPRLHEYLQEMHREVLSKYDLMTVGEALGVTLEQTPPFVDERRNELNMIFHFDLVRLDRDGWRWKPWNLQQFKAVCAKFNDGLDCHSWPTVYLTNHDNPRSVSHFGDDSPEYRLLSAKLLATFQLTSKGTPFLYQGDELGMTNFPFESIDQFDDIEVKNTWAAEKDHTDIRDFLEHQRKTSRDHTRTPMQWDDSAHAGFTTASKPWFAVNPNYIEINAKQALADDNSIYHYYARLRALRRQTLAFVYGDYRDLDPQDPLLFAYTRTLEAESYLVLLNFSPTRISYSLPEGLAVGELLLSNSNAKGENSGLLHLDAWEARIYTMKKGGESPPQN